MALLIYDAGENKVYTYNSLNENDLSVLYSTERTPDIAGVPGQIVLWTTIAAMEAWNPDLPQVRQGHPGGIPAASGKAATAPAASITPAWL